jgi:TolB-like protein/DNA-binding SARP family transcriptional activator
MVRLRVLGGFSLEGAPGAPALPRPQRRGDAVLAVLAVAGARGCTRERLAALLWAESDEGRSRQALRDALYAVRRTLDPCAVTSDGHLLRLDPGAVASDVQAFTQALACGRHADAVLAYAGPLLDGFHVGDAPEFERWLEVERGRLAREHREALEHLAGAAERSGAWHEAVAWWGRAVEHDPLNSHFVLQQARAMAAIGDRANALLAADAHVRRLREDLDLPPDREFLADIARIRDGVVPVRRGGAVLPASAAARLPPAADAGPVPQPAHDGAGRGHRRRWVWGGVAVAALAALFAAGRWLRGPDRLPPPRTAIAVLPFVSLGPDTSHAYLASGLHDELLSQLARVAELQVVGRMSVAGYRGSAAPPRRIAEELGVGSLAEATVQVIGNRLRVEVQLVEPYTGATLWSGTYTRTLNDAFAVESDIARRIVAAVGATLTNEEAGAIAAASSPNPQAYAFYLQGLEYYRRPGRLRSNLQAAGQLYGRALALDSAFAPAHAALSLVDFALHGLGYDPAPARRAQAIAEAQAAVRLAPNLPQAHFVAGLARYGGRGDVRGALKEFELAARGAPNDAEVWIWVGNARAALGAWDSSMAALARARRLDPRNADLLHVIGDRLHYLHRYREAIAAYRQEAALAPDVIQARLSLAWSYVMWKGDLDTLRAVLRDLPEDADPGMGGGSVGEQRLLLFWVERRPDSLLAVLQRLHGSAGAEAPGTLARTLWEARAHLLRGDTAAARATGETARAILGAQERASPDDVSVHAVRGAVLAALGRRAEALREARWIARTAAYRTNPDVAAQRAEMLALAGESDAALADLERALIGPSHVSAPMLRLFPNWDPILRGPRFRALLARYADPEMP